MVRWVRIPKNDEGDAVADEVDGQLDAPARELVVPRKFAPPVGALLQLDDPANSIPEDALAHRLWMIVDELSDRGSRFPAESATRIRGRIFRWRATWDGALCSAPHGEKLSFELRAAHGDGRPARLTELGFTRSHPRWWNALPDDAHFFFGANRAEALAHADAKPFEALWDEAAEPRFPFAGGAERDCDFIPIGMGALPAISFSAQHRGRTALERDGLANFSADLFIDPRLLEADATTLLNEADFIHCQDENAPPLTGMHAALDVEEATLIVVPDALHRGWKRATAESPPDSPPGAPLPHPSWWHFLECDPPESPPPNVTEPPVGHFLACELRKIAAPDLSATDPDASGEFTLRWISNETDAVFILQEAVTRDFADAVEIQRGLAQRRTLRRQAGTWYFRVRAEVGGETSDWSRGVAVVVGVPGGWEVETEKFQHKRLIDIHRALLRICAARADILAVLALPEEFREDDARAHIRELKAWRDFPEPGRPLPLNSGEEKAFSYAALYHPWQIVRDDAGSLRTLPPDGAAAGLIARRTIARGAWIAPANETFAGVVALTPAIGADRHLELLLAQLNLIRHEPQGFVALNADTLSDDPDLRPINVRRLLILLRRAALRLGANYVFESNDASLRRVVSHAFESMMQRLFVGGAFAGATPATSYQVVADDTLNTPQSVERGRFHVDLKVAPSLPMSFLTVRLVQLGDRSRATELS